MEIDAFETDVDSIKDISKFFVNVFKTWKRNFRKTSNSARIDTKPELEIIADDVRCTHGATVSQLQEEELFYLRSRGISSNQASYLLLKGYCQEIIDSLPLAANRWQILNKLLEDMN